MAKRVVISFGRFNPPTTGHGALIQFVAKTASRLNADAVVFPTQSQDAAKNPLPFKEKVAFLRLFFGRMMNFSDATAIRTPIHALEFLSRNGYDEVYVVVGSDRVAEFEKFGQYVKPTRGKNIITLSKYKVIPVPGERDPDADGLAGMSASKLRSLAVAGDYAAFRKGVPTRTDTAAERLFKSVRRHMGIRENRTIAIYGVTPKAAMPLREALAGMSYVDYTGKSLAEIRADIRLLESQGRKVTLYTRNISANGLVTEGYIARQSAYGLLKQELGRNIVEVRSADADVTRDVRGHVANLGRVQMNEAPAENPFHEILVKRGFVLSDTKKDVPNPLKKTALFDEWRYTYPGEKTNCVITKYHQPDYRGKQWHFIFRYEQDNGIMAPTTGDTKPQLIKTLEGSSYQRKYLVKEDGDYGKVKQPSEVDRLKDTQKQQTLAMKTRMSQELLQAKQRELQKKSREDQQKIVNGNKPSSITR